MSRFLRINKTVIHVPSLANVSMTTDCLGYSSLCLYYHTQTTQTLKCGNHEECEKQMMRIKTAMKAIETALEGIPLVEPVVEPTLIKSATLESTGVRGATATI